MCGGDLRFHIGRMRRFNEEQTSNYFIINQSSLLHLYLLVSSTYTLTILFIETLNQKI